MSVHYFSTSTQSVRDWSGILLERSGKRYSGKPDGDSRNAQKKLRHLLIKLTFKNKMPHFMSQEKLLLYPFKAE